MNHMEEVAKILNVEMDEEFKISGRKDTWKINEKGLVSKSKKGEWEPYNAILMLLLNGEEEIQKHILDEKEKEYLSNVIKPFRDDVKCIIKYSVDYVEWITICMKTCHDMDFPIFSVGTMYKGLELNKEYSLEELGL